MLFGLIKPKQKRWLGNSRSGAVHTIGNIKNQCNVDEITADHWTSLNSPEELNDFLGQEWHASGLKPHFCLHCFRG